MTIRRKLIPLSLCLLPLLGLAPTTAAADSGRGGGLTYYQDELRIALSSTLGALPRVDLATAEGAARLSAFVHRPATLRVLETIARQLVARNRADHLEGLATWLEKSYFAGLRAGHPLDAAAFKEFARLFVAEVRAGAFRDRHGLGEAFELPPAKPVSPRASAAAGRTPAERAEWLAALQGWNHATAGVVAGGPKAAKRRPGTRQRGTARSPR